MSLLAGIAASMLLLAGSAVAYRPLLLWNASASSPRGLYSVDAGPPRKGEMAVAWAPPEARALAAMRHYLPATVPLVKRVAAVAPARVCASGRDIMIDGRPVARRRRSDGSRRPLPWWSGCRRLRAGELFLLSEGAPDAFDGRYFGPVPPSLVIGRAWLLWRR